MPGSSGPEDYRKSRARERLIDFEWKSSRYCHATNAVSYDPSVSAVRGEAMLIRSRNPVRQERRRAEAPSPTVARFVLLSMLLHATVVILFGTSHGGGAGRGEGGLDVLDVTLRRQLTMPDLGLRSEPGTEMSLGRDRLGQPDEHPPPPAAPVTSAPPIERARTEAPLATEPSPHSSLETEHETGPSTPLQPAEPLPRVDLRAPQEVDKPLASPWTATPIEHLELPSSPPPLAAPIELPSPATPLAPATPIERLQAPARQHELAPPVELAPRVTPILPAAPIERLAEPAAQKELAAPVEVPARVAPIVPAPIDRLPSPQIERQLAAPPDVTTPGPSATPRAAPLDGATAPIGSAAPSPGARPQQAPAPESAAPRAAPGAPAPGGDLPRLRLGAPAGDDDIFKPRPDAAAPAGESAPSIDLDAARKRAREIASESIGTRGILAALPPPPERKTKESALEKAAKPDCRTAYAGMGLLAVPVLVASTIGDGACRW